MEKQLLEKEVDLVTDHLRLLAALLIKRPDLEESDKNTFAQVIYDLADRLDQANRGNAKCAFSSLTGKNDRQ